MFAHIKQNFEYSLCQNKIVKKSLQRILSNDEKKYSSLSFVPPRIKFYPVEREKQVINKINNKISIFLIDMNEGKRVFANEVCALYIPCLEKVWPH